MKATLSLSHGFAPVIGDAPKFLILGSMPGVKSLEEQQYYAHPRNAFWPIMATLYGFDIDLSYDERCRLLTEHGVAVWDVLQTCQRPGSLDSRIQTDSIVVNDFITLFEQQPTLTHIIFNGAKAESLFKSHVKNPLPRLSFQRVPSTSPAHAALNFEQKLQYWRQAFDR